MTRFIALFLAIAALPILANDGPADFADAWVGETKVGIAAPTALLTKSKKEFESFPSEKKTKYSVA